MSNSKKEIDHVSKEAELMQQVNMLEKQNRAYINLINNHLKPRISELEVHCANLSIEIEDLRNQNVNVKTELVPTNVN